MLTYDMEKRGKTPAYRYIYHEIKKDILSGELSPNEKLPSKRSLATHLGISVVTVMSAYELLVSEGYVYTKPQSGYYVVPIKAQKQSFHSETILPTKEKTPDFDFSGNSVSSSAFPFSVWSRLMRRVLLDYEGELLAPIPYNGALVLREAVSKYLYHHSGMSVDPRQIIVGAGTEYLYSLIIQLVGKDKVYAVENPGYNKISKIYGMNGVETEYINVDSKGLSIDELMKSKASVVHISPSHHYPTGIVMPVDRRNEILNWADEKGGYIIEDDYDSEFGSIKAMNTLFGTDKNERVLYLNTFSKTIAPSMRISYLILPPHLLEKYQKKLNFLSCTVPSFEQYTLASFINEGYFERHIARMKKQYSLLKKEVMEILDQSTIRDKISLVENMSGLHFLMKIDTAKSDIEIIDSLEKRGIGGKFLSQYYQKGEKIPQHYMIVNYSGFDKTDLPDALKILGEVI